MFNLFKKTALTKTIFFVAGDIFCIAISIWLAFLLRFNFSMPAQYLTFVYKMIGLTAVFICLFSTFKNCILFPGRMFQPMS